MRTNGFATVDQEWEDGHGPVAVPVSAAGGHFVAVNVRTHAQRLPVEDLESRSLPRLLASAGLSVLRCNDPGRLAPACLGLLSDDQRIRFHPVKCGKGLDNFVEIKLD